MSITNLTSALTFTFLLIATSIGVAQPAEKTALDSWQRPADKDVADNPNSGGSLMVDGDSSYLPRIRYHVDVHIEDGFARTTIDQVYFNRTSRRQEGTYRFPIPSGASISRLAMTVKGKLLEGGMVEQKRAAAIYDEIRRKRRDPVLLEWIDGRTFKMRVFPIEPGEYKRIIISYTQRLEAIDDHWHYSFPGTDLQKTQESSIKVRAVSGIHREWECDTHELKASNAGSDLLLETETAKGSILGENKFLLRIKRRQRYAHEEPIRFEYFNTTEHRFVMLRWRPDIDVKPTPPALSPRSWTVLFEASADRDPVFARQQIEVLRDLIAANPDDYFYTIVANTEPTVQAFRGSDINQLENVHLIGALDLGQAFAKVAFLTKNPKESFIVHLGGGRPSMGTRRTEDLVKLLPENVPYIGVGIGREVNSELMQAAAKRNGGGFAVIEDGQELVQLARRVSSNSRKITVTSADGTRFLSDGYGAFAGGDYFAVARLDRKEELPVSITLHSEIAGGEWSRKVEPRWNRSQAGYLPRTWARLEIDRLAEEAEANRAAIVALSQQAFVMSPFTSLLVLESAEMHKHYGVGQGRSDHWAKYTAPLGKLTYKPEPEKKREPKPRDEEGAERPGLKNFSPKFPRPMFIGTPVSVRLPNLEGPRSRTRSARPLIWRPMFAGQVVGLADDWQTPLKTGWQPRRTFRAPKGTELLSLDCKVMASDDLPIIGELDYITDGDKDGSDGSYVELGPNRQWVQIDLGEKRELWAVILWHFHKNARAYIDVVVQISDDPEFKDGVRTIYNADHDNSSGLGVGSDKAYIETSFGRIIDVPGTAARYLRFYSNGNTANEMNHYIEIEVWGRKDVHEGEVPVKETVGWERVAQLEAAMEEEWQHQNKRGAIELDWLRESHAELLAAIANALADGPAPADQELEPLITRTADRWWAIDAGASEPCHMAAALFRQLGRMDLSWQYLTTPTAIDNGSAFAWYSVETFARRHKDPAMAELARREAGTARDAK